MKRSRSNYLFEPDAFAAALRALLSAVQQER